MSTESGVSEMTNGQTNAGNAVSRGEDQGAESLHERLVRQAKLAGSPCLQVYDHPNGNALDGSDSA